MKPSGYLFASRTCHTLLTAMEAEFTLPADAADSSGGHSTARFHPDLYPKLSAETFLAQEEHVAEEKAQRGLAASQPSFLTEHVAAQGEEGGLASPAAFESSFDALGKGLDHASLLASLGKELPASLRNTGALDGLKAVLAAYENSSSAVSSEQALARALITPPSPSELPEPLPLRLAICQMHAHTGDIAGNLGRVEDALKALQSSGSPADLLAFPEAFLQGYHVGETAARALALRLPSDEEVEHYLQQQQQGRHEGEGSGSTTSSNTAVGDGSVVGSDGPTALPSTAYCFASALPLLQVCALAARYRTALLLPYIEAGVIARSVSSGDAEKQKEEERKELQLLVVDDPRNPPHAAAAGLPPIYNSSLLIDSDGSIAGHYRKCHLWGRDYEKRIYTPGPGPAYSSSGNALQYYRHPTLGVGPSPFTPFCIKACPSIPIGLLVCFDLEFPEATRLLALRGAKLVVASMASGELQAMTSRKIVATRAAESHVAAVYCNFPAGPLPWAEEVEQLRQQIQQHEQHQQEEREEEEKRKGESAGEGKQSGSTSSPAAVAPFLPDYAGGSTACGQDGKVLLSLPPFSWQPRRGPPELQGKPAEPIAAEEYGYDAEGSAAATALLRQLEGRKQQAQAEKRAESRSAGSSASGGPAAAAAQPPLQLPVQSPFCDEHISIVLVAPWLQRYKVDEERNPYLEDRRTDLYGDLLQTEGARVQGSGGGKKSSSPAAAGAGAGVAAGPGGAPSSTATVAEEEEEEATWLEVQGHLPAGNAGAVVASAGAAEA